MSGTALKDLVPEGLGFSILEEIGAYDFDYWNGRLLVWEAPDAQAVYTLGVDPGQGKGEDRSVVQVIRNGDLKRGDEQVAEFASNFHGPVELAPVVAAIGRLYKGFDDEALAVIECNTAGGGDTCQFDLRSRFAYSNLFIWKTYDKRTNLWTQRLGWWTTAQSRGKVVARGLHSISSGDLKVHSPFLLDEMEDFETDLHLARAKARFGRHDDRVMALLIGHWGAHDEEWLAGEDISAERKRLTTAEKLADVEERRSGVKADYQNTPVSAERMWEMAEDD